MIRPLRKEDLAAAKLVIDSSELFPSEMLDNMTAEYFNDPNTSQRWLIHEANDQINGIAFYAPEAMTEGTWNLYLIAVHKNTQGKGIGGQIMTNIEARLQQENQRILIVETSGLPAYALTRKFYHQLNYQAIATIPEFYTAGEDKVVYWKKLA